MRCTPTAATPPPIQQNQHRMETIRWNRRPQGLPTQRLTVGSAYIGREPRTRPTHTSTHTRGATTVHHSPPLRTLLLATTGTTSIRRARHRGNAEIADVGRTGRRGSSYHFTRGMSAVAAPADDGKGDSESIIVTPVLTATPRPDFDLGDVRSAWLVRRLACGCLGAGGGICDVLIACAVWVVVTTCATCPA